MENEPTCNTAFDNFPRLLSRAFGEPIFTKKHEDFIGVLQTAGDVGEFAERDHDIVRNLVGKCFQPFRQHLILLLVLGQLFQLLFRNFKFLKLRMNAKHWL